MLTREEKGKLVLGYLWCCCCPAAMFVWCYFHHEAFWVIALNAYSFFTSCTTLWMMSRRFKGNAEERSWQESKKCIDALYAGAEHYEQ